jgi:hypothetical protein
MTNINGVYIENLNFLNKVSFCFSKNINLQKNINSDYIINNIFNNIGCNKHNLAVQLNSINNNIVQHYREKECAMKMYIALRTNKETLYAPRGENNEEKRLMENPAAQVIKEWGYNIISNTDTGLSKNSLSNLVINSTIPISTHSHSRQNTNNYNISSEKSLIIAPIVANKNTKVQNNIGVFAMSFKDDGFVSDSNKLLTSFIANQYSHYLSKNRNNIDKFTATLRDRTQ